MYMAAKRQQGPQYRDSALTGHGGWTNEHWIGNESRDKGGRFGLWSLCCQAKISESNSIASGRG